MTSGSLVAGESYTLECSAGGSEGTFQWLKGPPNGRTLVISSGSVTISSNSTTSQLQFRPIQQSNNGSYFCNITIGGVALLSEPVVISVNGMIMRNIVYSEHNYVCLILHLAPSVSVQISDSGATPAAGENYQLTCSISGTGNLNPTISYQWIKNSGSGQTQVGTSLSTLSFTPMRLSDAASYVCKVTITSSYLSEDIIAKSFNPLDIRIQSEY